ncbi:MAG TPA: pitrilysin family protein [Candidatus Kapabacteria bacterium]|nr:pitrilysin family protein [Candidatus Kapabacteria bacterium]
MRKQIMKKIFIAIICVVAMRSGFGQTAAHKFTVGGIDVVLQPTTANEVISGILFIKGGTSYLPSNETVAIEQLSLGVAAESGSTKYTKDDYQKKLNRMVSTISGSGGQDYSTMSLRCVREHFNDTWNLFTDVIMSPAFDSTEIMKAKRASITAIRSVKSNPDAYIRYLLDSLYFAGHPYSRHATVDEVNAITTDRLQAHFKELFVKSRLLLVVVGNVKEADLRSKIEATLAKLPEGTYTAPDLRVPAEASTSGFIGAEKHIPTTYIMGFYNAPTRMDKDYWPMFIGAETLSDRLFEEIRTKRNLSYAPYSGLNPNRTSVGELYVTTTLPDSAVKVMFACVDSLQKYPISEEELKGEVSQFITAIYTRQETSESQALVLGIYDILAGSYEKAEQVITAIQKVTPEEIQKAANKYIHNINFAVVGDIDNVDQSLFKSR